ncbi:hypothetical protein [Nocardia pseudobrasiliensis]|uniref:hypothetical protein n=1 Tax=Nocardia pseudobrasiliensis TaxID=45979 RepID=UPI0035A22727
MVAAPRGNRAFVYTWTCGPFYLLIAALGFLGGGNVLHLMAVDTFGNIVHVVEGSLVLSAFALSASLPGLREPRSDAVPS